MGIKKFIARITGLDKVKQQLEDEAAEAIQRAKEAQNKAEAETARAVAMAEESTKAASEAAEAARLAEEAEAVAKMSPKERATRKGEPWVSVLDTHVSKDNIRNGFFELDWNPEFVLELKRAGYGADGDPDEEIVDRWFRDIVYNMFAEAGIDVSRGAGYINVIPIDRGRSEVS